MRDETFREYEIVRAAKDFDVSYDEEHEFVTHPLRVKRGDEGQVQAVKIEDGIYQVRWGTRPMSATQWHTADELLVIPKMEISRDEWWRDYLERRKRHDADGHFLESDRKAALKLWPELAKYVAGNLDKEVDDLLNWVPEVLPYTDEQLEYWHEDAESMKDVPLVSERGLYTLLGKDDARTFRAYLRAVLKAAGVHKDF